MTYPAPGQYQQVSQVCTWHPDRPTGLSCTRCGRPACPECLTPASVGFHCRACQAESRSTQRVPRTIAGGVHGRQPIVSYALIAVNVLVFVITMVQGGGESGLGNSWVFNKGALTPMFVASGEWWQFITSGFLHAGVLHVAVNMFSLYLIGIGLERVLGPLRFSVVYFLSLLGGSVAVYLLSDVAGATVGASGAIFGLFGALAVTLKRLKSDLRQIGFVLVLNAVITFTQSGISWQGHVGGFVVGLIVGAAMVYPPARSRAAWQWGVSAGVLIALIGLIVYRDSTIGEWVCSTTACRQIG